MRYIPNVEWSYKTDLRCAPNGARLESKVERQLSLGPCLINAAAESLPDAPNGQLWFDCDQTPIHELRAVARRIMSIRLKVGGSPLKV